MIVVPDEAERADLDRFLSAVAPLYRLFTNDLTPTASTVLGNFIEADWPDYVPHSVTSWVPALTVAGRAVSTADQQLWVRGPGGPPRQVFGYFVTDGSSGPLLWCERRPQGPLPMMSSAHAVLILPRITLAECQEGPTPLPVGGDLVGEGGAVAPNPPLIVGGDLVGEGETTIVPPPLPVGGDLVGEGTGPVILPPLPVGGDLVGEGGS